MDNNKTAKYYVKKILDDIDFCIKHLNNIDLNSFAQNEVLSTSISFKFIQISENAKKLPDIIYDLYTNVPWIKISGLRNKIVHDYGSIQLYIIYDTIKKDFPILKENMMSILKDEPNTFWYVFLFFVFKRKI